MAHLLRKSIEVTIQRESAGRYLSPRVGELIWMKADRVDLKKSISSGKGNVCRYCYFIISGC